MKDDPSAEETFSQRHYSKPVSPPYFQNHEHLSACVYRDFGAWRAVAEYRNERIWIKYAATSTEATQDEAQARANALVDELLSYLEKAGIRAASPG